MTKDELINKLKANGFSEKIVRAFAAVDREKFIPDKYKEYAYEDMALPLSDGQTISQPYTVAFMLDLLEVRDEQKILEVGSGSGYALELLANLAGKAKIYGTERIASLVQGSKDALKNYKNIKIAHAPNVLGLPEEAPFDRILASASAEKLPEELLKQLKDGGIIVCPVKESIVKAEKEKNKIKIEEFPGFVFVPLITKTAKGEKYLK